MLAQIFTADWFMELYQHVPTLVLRTILTFFTVLLVVRWTGKRSIANLAPFDMAMVIMIGEVAAIPVSELRVDLLHGILPVFLIAALHVLMTTISLRSKTFERWIEGKPTLLVKNGKVLAENLRKERVSMDDLKTALRHKEVLDLRDVKEAWIEHAGGVSVIRNESERAALSSPQMDAAMEEAIERIVRETAAAMRRELVDLLRRPPEWRPPD
ncbi:MAG: DUF421 domain-containing protein [Mycobacterium leprae]